MRLLHKKKSMIKSVQKENLSTKSIVKNFTTTKLSKMIKNAEQKRKRLKNKDLKSLLNFNHSLTCIVQIMQSIRL